jgi:hypothetical protein
MRALGDVRRKAPLEPKKEETPVAEQTTQESLDEDLEDSFEESVELT